MLGDGRLKGFVSKDTVICVTVVGNLSDLKIWLFYPYQLSLQIIYVLTVDSSQTCCICWSCISLLFTFIAIVFVGSLF